MYSVLVFLLMDDCPLMSALQMSERETKAMETEIDAMHIRRGHEVRAAEKRLAAIEEEMQRVRDRAAGERGEMHDRLVEADETVAALTERLARLESFRAQGRIAEERGLLYAGELRHWHHIESGMKF